MAIFFTNRCHFQSCGLTFETLKDLILHIEQTHLDNPSSLIDRATGFLPLSCIIRFYSEEEACRLPIPVPVSHNQHHHIHHKTSGHGTVGAHHGGTRHRAGGGSRRAQQAAALASLQVDADSSALNGTTNGGQGEDTLDAQCRSVAAGVLAGLGVLGPNQGSGTSNSTAGGLQTLVSSPTATTTSSRGVARDASGSVVCQHEGCNKRYKNINGLRYHMRHVHNRGGGAAGGSSGPPPNQQNSTATNAGKQGANSSTNNAPPGTVGAQVSQLSNSATSVTGGEVQQQLVHRGRGGVIMRGGSVGPVGTHTHGHLTAHRCRLCGVTFRTLSELHSHHSSQHSGQPLHSVSTTSATTSSSSGGSDLRLALTSAPSSFARSTSSIAASNRMAATELLLSGEPPSKPLPTYVALVSAPQQQQQIQQVITSQAPIAQPTTAPAEVVQAP